MSTRREALSEASPTPTTATSTRSDLSRRGFLRAGLLLVAAIPLAQLQQTVARAERRRKRHRGGSTDPWLGHC